MARAILGVVSGYVVMFVVVSATFSGAYAAMGPERAFEPASYDVSALWLVTSIVLGLLAAIAGGLICAVAARRGSRAPLVLAGFVFLLGAAMGVQVFVSDPPREVRLPYASASGAMMKARTPAYAAAVNPLIGAAGVLGGAWLRGGRRKGAAD